VTVQTHFVQAGDGPVLIGSASGTLACACGHTLVQGFEPAGFLAIGIQCARCGTVTATPPLPEGDLPPRSAIIAAPSAEPRTTAMTVPPDIAVVGQAEMERLQALSQPVSPGHPYEVSAALLDAVVAGFERHTGGALPEVPGGDQFAGLREHALAWSVRHLRARLQDADWSCGENAATSIAVVHVTGFQHFLATWSRHPLLPAMVATAGERGFSSHGLAPFNAAYCLFKMGNQVRFPDPLGYPGRIDGLDIVAGSSRVGVQIEVFDRFEFPFGRRWDPTSLVAAVSESMAAAQSRINLRNPGLLVLSPGIALAGLDERLIEAMTTAMQNNGRRNRGLMAVAIITSRLQALPEPHEVRFVYGFFPIANRHYRGESLLQLTG
jgi:hypothetical protein